MARETWVQSQVKSYQRPQKWYLVSPCLTLSIIRYGTWVKWSNSRKAVVSSPTPWCSSYRKREPSGHPQVRSPTLLTNMKILVIDIGNNEQRNSFILNKFNYIISTGLHIPPPLPPPPLLLHTLLRNLQGLVISKRTRLLVRISQIISK